MNIGHFYPFTMVSQSEGLFLGRCTITPKSMLYHPVLQMLHSSDSLTCVLDTVFFIFPFCGSLCLGLPVLQWSICWPAAQLMALHDCPFSSRSLLLDSLLPDSGFFSCLSVSLTSSAPPSVGLRVSKPVFLPLPTPPQGSGPKPQQLPEAPPLCLLHRGSSLQAC